MRKRKNHVPPSDWQSVVAKWYIDSYALSQSPIIPLATILSAPVPFVTMILRKVLRRKCCGKCSMAPPMQTTVSKGAHGMQYMSAVRIHIHGVCPGLVRRWKEEESDATTPTPQHPAMIAISPKSRHERVSQPSGAHARRCFPWRTPVKQRVSGNGRRHIVPTRFLA